MLDRSSRDESRDLCVFENQIAEIQILFPSAHGMRLHHSICVLPGHAVLHQIEQKLSAENQTAGAFEVAHHALGVDEHRVDEVGGLLQQVIHQRGRIRNDYALD